MGTERKEAEEKPVPSAFGGENMESKENTERKENAEDVKNTKAAENTEGVKNTEGAGNEEDGKKTEDRAWEDDGLIREGKKIRSRLPSNHTYSVISFYVIVTFIAVFVLAKIGNNLDRIAMALGAGLHWLRIIFIPLALGFAIAYLFAPVVRFFRRRLEKLPWYRKKNKSALGLSVAITFAAVAAAIALGMTFLISAFTHELTVASFDNITGFVKGISRSFNEVYGQLQRWLSQMNISSDTLASVTDSIASWAGGLASRAGRNLSNALTHLTGYLTSGLFAVIFAIYFSLDYEGLRRYWKKFVRALFPDRAVRAMRTAVRDADGVFSGYIRGQLLDALFMMVAVTIVLLLLNVKFAVIIGVLTGFGNLIPYVGPFVAYGGTAFVGIMSQDWKKLIISVIAVFILQTIDGNVVNPRLLSHAVKVHPMLVIIALIIGSKVGGLAGMILAVPVAALLKLWLDRWIGFMAREKEKRAEAAKKEERDRGALPG